MVKSEAKPGDRVEIHRDKIIYEGIKGEYDCFGLVEPFPDGLDCTILSYRSLKEADQKATLLSDREHVCPFIERENNVFKCGSLQLFESHNEKRWTLDEEADLELITEIYKNLYHDEKMFFTEDILRLLKKKPALEKINNHIIRNEGYLHSLN